jgi:hypothetical protein
MMIDSFLWMQFAPAFTPLFGIMDWIHLAQDRSQWQGLLNTIMSLLVPQNSGNFLIGSAIINSIFLCKGKLDFI